MSRELAAENWWNRKRKLLPTLRLTYPRDDELRQIATLAGVDHPTLFARDIRSIILDAHLDDASLRKLSIPHVIKALNDEEVTANISETPSAP